MNLHPCRCALVIWIVFSTTLQSSAQTPPVKSTTRTQDPSTANDSSTQDEAKAVATMRRSTALALVSTLADEARDYRNETLRVRVQARAAEVLWESDRDRARFLFHRAWDAADLIDKAGERRVKEDRRKLLTGPGGPTFIPSPPNLRLEVLRFASRCDRELSEKFLATLEEEKKKEADVGSETSPVSRWDPTEPPSAINKRLELGILLLERGEVERALQFADPALARVTQLGITFLYKLQQKDAAAANQRFAALLSRMAGDRLADANSVSLLSTYAFTPLIFATVTFNGRAYGGEPAPVPVLPVELRDAFFRTAAQVLLRPLPPPDQDFSSAGRAGTYFVIARLLPLFQQYAPDRVPELSAHLTSLTQDTPLPVRDDHTMLTAGFISDASFNDDLSAMSARLRTANSHIERDRIYLSALRGITKTDPRRAREIADKIESPELRKRAIAFVDFAAVRTALEKKNTQDALRITRSGTLPPIQRVWAYTEVTQQLKDDSAGAIQLLNEAAAEARRIDQSSPQRAQTLTAIATSFLDVDRVQAWEVMAEAIKAANYATDFDGENGRVTAHLQTGRMVATFDFEAPSFDLSGIFRSLAQDDLHRAIELAQRFTSEEPRAIAILTIARSVLEEKPKQKSRAR
jgi:hypothetical protein